MMRSKIRNLFYVVCGVALVPACGDDSGSQDGGETETEGDESESEGSVTVTTTVSPETTDGETTETNGTVDDTTTTGGPCLLPEEIFDDPSFEEGTPWGQASDAFMTPLCTVDTCGGGAASDGATFAWYGGITAPDAAGLAQTVIINETDEAITLAFDFQIGSSSGTTEDVFYVTVDGTEIFSATAADMAMYPEYTTVEIDVSAYADGAEHEFEFIGLTYGGDPFTSFFLDNLHMGGCDAGEAVTVTDSVTGIDINDIPVAMCDDDLSNTVPQTVMGTTVDQGNDAQGSCTPGTGGEDVVYAWTAPAAGTYQFDTIGSAADTVLYIYDACMDGEEIACNDDIAGANFQSILALEMEMDQTIAIAVDSYNAASGGEFELHITQVACDAPTDLMDTVPLNEPGTNVGAGDDVTPSCVAEVGGEDVVYSWSAPADALYIFDTMGSSIDAALAIYDGTCGAVTSEIACAADAEMASEIVLPLASGTMLSIVVDGVTMADAGDFDLNITSSTLAGDCCATDASSGCASLMVTACVCDLRPQCCTGEWDDTCVGLAATQCDAGCAAVPGGSCCMEQATPGCDTPAIQDCLCPLDPVCCGQDMNMMGVWDQICVDEAVELCNAECN